MDPYDSPLQFFVESREPILPLATKNQSVLKIMQGPKQLPILILGAPDCKYSRMGTETVFSLFRPLY